METRRTRRGLVDWLEARFNLTESFSFLTSFGFLPAELDIRLPLREALDDTLRKPMPSFVRWPRVLGVLAAQLLMFLVVTGLMLTLYYQPSPEGAHGSTTTIVRDVNFGWFVHQSHLWAARALIAILLLRLARFFFQRVYTAPREGLWIVAYVMMLVALLADMTGRLLPWTADAYWQTVRALEVLSSLPVLGRILTFLLGGQALDSLVLTRFYVFHVLLLPALLLALFHLNLVGLRRVGLTSDQGQPTSGQPSYQVYLYNLLILSVLVFGTILTFATLLPEPFAAPADPLVTPAGVRPPWYLLACHAVLEALPAAVPRGLRGLLVEIALLLVLLVPFLDRRPEGARKRPVATAVGITVLAALAFLTWYGYRLEVLP